MNFRCTLKPLVACCSILVATSLYAAQQEPISPAAAASAQTQTTAQKDQMNEHDQQILRDLNLNQYLVDKLSEKGGHVTSGHNENYRYNFKKPSELKSDESLKATNLVLDTEVRNFSLTTDVEKIDSHFQKRHELTYSIIFRLLNDEQQILFEQEKNFEAVYGSYETKDANPYDLSPIIQKWIEDKVEITLDEVAQKMEAVLDPVVITSIKGQQLQVSTSQAQFQGREAHTFVVYKPVKLMQHPSENRLMRIPGEVVGHAIYKGYENGHAVFELKEGSKLDKLEEPLYIVNS